jgi:hypothetical protein
MLLIKCAWVPVHHPTNSVAWGEFRLDPPPIWRRELGGGWYWHRLQVSQSVPNEQRG